jgi:hypothetical protein
VVKKNTFLATPDDKNIFFQNLIPKNSKKNTSDVKKYLFLKLDSGGLEVCANASEHVYYLFRR